MRETERQTRSYLMDLFAEHGFHPRRDLGQNFLIDLNILEFVVERAELGPRDVVLEVGAGTGGLTTYLAQQAGDVVSVEVDPRMQQLAAQAISAYSNVTLLSCDALKNKNRFADPVMAALREKLGDDGERRVKLVANLPYSIATPVVSNLVASDLPWKCMIITIQVELAEKMQASPGSDDYGALSVWLQSQCYVRIIKRMGPTVFWPRPQVDSAIVKLVPDHTRAKRIVNRKFFHEFVRRLFTQRRKLLRSTLVGMYRKDLEKPEVDAILAQTNVSSNARAELMGVGELTDLANLFYAALCQRFPQRKDELTGNLAADDDDTDDAPAPAADVNDAADAEAAADDTPDDESPSADS